MSTLKDSIVPGNYFNLTELGSAPEIIKIISVSDTTFVAHRYETGDQKEYYFADFFDGLMLSPTTETTVIARLSIFAARTRDKISDLKMRITALSKKADCYEAGLRSIK